MDTNSYFKPLNRTAVYPYSQVFPIIHKIHKPNCPFINSQLHHSLSKHRARYPVKGLFKVNKSKADICLPSKKFLLHLTKDYIAYIVQPMQHSQEIASNIIAKSNKLKINPWWIPTVTPNLSLKRLFTLILKFFPSYIKSYIISLIAINNKGVLPILVHKYCHSSTYLSSSCFDYFLYHTWWSSFFPLFDLLDGSYHMLCNKHCRPFNCFCII